MLNLNLQLVDSRPRLFSLAQGHTASLFPHAKWRRTVVPHQRAVGRSLVVRAASTDLTVSAAALRSRLKRYDTIETTIQCSFLELLGGAVSRVDIYGRGWESKAGLTARLLEITLGAAQLDVEAVLFKQRIILKSIPRGTAKIVFTAQDFGNFLAHPLMRQAASTAIQGGAFDFDQFSVQFNSFYGASGAISFAGTWPINQSRYKLTMVPQQSTVQVTALSDSLTMSADQSADMVLDDAADASGADESSVLVSEQLSRFFSNLTISLQGIELTYDSMRLTSQPAEAGGDVLELFLRVAVLDFPPPSIAF